MDTQKPGTPSGYFSRETLERQSTDLLLILLPEYWQIFKDSGCWNIGHMDTDKNDFRHPTQCGHTLREYLIEFLLQYPFTGDEIEISRWALASMQAAAPQPDLRNEVENALLGALEREPVSTRPVAL